MDEVQQDATRTPEAAPAGETGAAASQPAPSPSAQPAPQKTEGGRPPRREDRLPRPAPEQKGEQRPGGGERREPRGNDRPGGDRSGDRGPDRGGERREGRGDDRRGDRREGPRPGGGRPFEGPPDIELEKLIADSLYLDNQAHAVVARMRDMDSGTKSQLRRLYNAVRRAVRAPESERQHHFVMLRARLAYTIARHSLRSLDALERLLLQVTRRNDARGYERFKDLFEAIVAYNE